jgi:hypothetical protein
VQHHLGVLGVVDPALAEPDLVLVLRCERVVGAPLVIRTRCGSSFTPRSREPKPSDWMYRCASVIQK